ncbi:hypothetical protein A9Q84_02030 [Halobacteriovorax marinus]|uniref:Uncharacterized protein n=1 Tax=Halobacteriovorax marinus TaxID=97084 RepID=A0A1Y5FCL5_9BACT|nr:hypothetical protein A9Q84_02030 [Halobacteriovorax marinus]
MSSTIKSTTKNIKVYETSIVPKGEELAPVRPSGYVATSMQIEVLHVIVFVFLFFAIFGGIWKLATQNEKKEETEVNATGLNHTTNA